MVFCGAKALVSIKSFPTYLQLQTKVNEARFVEKPKIVSTGSCTTKYVDKGVRN